MLTKESFVGQMPTLLTQTTELGKLGEAKRKAPLGVVTQWGWQKQFKSEKKAKEIESRTN